MAMRTYGVETKGMAIKFGEVQKLISKNKESVLKVVGEDFFYDIDDISDDIIEFTEMIDYAFWVSEFDGTLISDDFSKELDYFDGDDVVIIELQNNTLYKKYNNREEIIDELKKSLEKAVQKYIKDFKVERYDSEGNVV